MIIITLFLTNYANGNVAYYNTDGNEPDSSKIKPEYLEEFRQIKAKLKQKPLFSEYSGQQRFEREALSLAREYVGTTELGQSKYDKAITSKEQIYNLEDFRKNERQNIIATGAVVTLVAGIIAAIIVVFVFEKKHK